MGYRSALSFFKYLSERDGVSIHYPQYKRIELGTILPQADLVRRLTKVLPEYSKLLVHSYCSDLFPEMSEVFDLKAIESVKASQTTGLLYPQEELTTRQVMMIAKSQSHYAVYLLLTLARKPVSLKEIESSIHDFDPEVLDELIETKIVFRENDSYKARTIERKFPEAHSREIEAAYRKLDQWDVSIGKVFRLETAMDKSIFRRISPRYIPILLKQAEALVDQSRASDEVDPIQNSEVMSLVVRLQRGKLAG
jgi:hypothetical protein